MQGIFISYRRQDSQSAAGRLADHVKEHIPDVPVFRDVETIEPGVDFIEAINRALESCGVLLAVIGPKWVSLTDAAGRRRVDNPNDYTRLEITTALKRKDVRVIPVLVEGAQMSEPDDLPEDLQGLCRRNAIELTDKRWNFDVLQLVGALKKVLDIEPLSPPSRPAPSITPGSVTPAAPTPTQLTRDWRLNKKQWGGIVTIACVVMLILGNWAIQKSRPMNGDASSSNLPNEAAASVTSAEEIVPTPALEETPIGFSANSVLENLENMVNVGSRSKPVVATTKHILTGTWEDEHGGRYHLNAIADQLYEFTGNGRAGPVEQGQGLIEGNTLKLLFNFKGAPATLGRFEISADGNSLRGAYHKNLIGEGEPTVMMLQRIP